MVYDISYKVLIGVKLLHIRFNQVYGFIRVYDGKKYLVLFDLEKVDAIYNKIRYLRGVKCDIRYVFSLYYAKIKVEFYDFFPIKKLTLHNVIIHINSVLNKDQTQYYCNMFLEKCSHQLPKK